MLTNLPRTFPQIFIFISWFQKSSASAMDDDQSISRFGHFPDEIILIILRRLPVKSLFRIKCVCKSWYAFVSSNYFKLLYNEISSRNPMVLLDVVDASFSQSSLICVDNNLSGDFDFSLDFIRDRVMIRASCCGLLCCSSIPDKGVYYVCNPMTRTYKLLPRFRERTRFHPEGEATLVGLACSLSSQKFSVVLAGHHRSFGHRRDQNFICLVYDSESNKWRKFFSLQDDSFPYINRKQAVYVSDALHWLTQSCSCLLVLDLKCDVWRRIGLPDEVGCIGTRIYLLELEGCLSVIQISDAWMNTWIMRDYEKEEWCMIEKVSLQCVRGMVPRIFPITQTEDCVFFVTHKHVLVYQRGSKSWKEMYSAKNSPVYPLWFSALAFRSTTLSCQ